VGVERALAANPASHPAAHHANFATAICMILRRCGCGVGGVEWMECRTFFGVAGFAHKPNF